MIKEIAVLCVFTLVLCGCGSSSLPQLVGNPGSDEPWNIKPKDTEPKPKSIDPAPKPKLIQSEVPDGWLPPSQVEKPWKAIILHHSATENGNAAIFDRMHREVRHWDGVGYDFVIGNGTDSGDGEVEVTFRWQKQVAGAHCGGTPNNWANEDAVGICLVGNFNNTVPTANQMKSLVKLVRFLQKRYGIRTSNIYGHRTTPGARVTECPGKNFPLEQLKEMLGP